MAATITSSTVFGDQHPGTKANMTNPNTLIQGLIIVTHVSDLITVPYDQS